MDDTPTVEMVEPAELAPNAEPAEPEQASESAPPVTAVVVLVGSVSAAGRPAAGAVVVATDEGRPVASVTADPRGAFVLAGLPSDGAVTVRAVEPTWGAATAVVALPPEAPVELKLTVGECLLHVDLPEPRWLVSEPFLASWSAEPLVPACPTCPTYRWFWDRPGLTPVVLRLDFTPEGVRSTVRVPASAPAGGARGESAGTSGSDAWDEHVTVLSARHVRRLDRAIGISGFWQLEHLAMSRGCFPQGSEWTMEGVASPGYRALYRTEPLGTPVAYLGRQWLRAVGLRVRRKDFR